MPKIGNEELKFFKSLSDRELSKREGMNELNDIEWINSKEVKRYRLDDGLKSFTEVYLGLF